MCNVTAKPNQTALFLFVSSFVSDASHIHSFQSLLILCSQDFRIDLFHSHRDFFRNLRQTFIFDSLLVSLHLILQLNNFNLTFFAFPTFSLIVVTSVVCPIPESPKNGKAIYTSLSYNSIVSYECRYGYTLVNDSSRRCGADRKWSGTLPTCKEINCGPPGILYNGWLENIDAGTGLGASIIFRCQPGMLLVGNTSTVCQIDGRWRYPVPECLGMTSPGFFSFTCYFDFLKIIGFFD